MSDNDQESPADAQKKKRGLWGWLKSGFEDPVPRFTHAPPPEAGATAEEGREAAPEPLGDAPAVGDASTSAPSAAEAEVGLGGLPTPVGELVLPVLVEAMESAGVPAFGVPREQPPAPVAEHLPVAQLAVESFPPVPAVEPEPEAPFAEGPNAIASEGAQAGSAAAFGVAPEDAPGPEAHISLPAPEVPPPAVAAPALPPVEEVAPEAVLPAAEPAAVVPAEVEGEPQPVKKGFWSRLAAGLARTASSLGQGITDLVSKRKLDADTLEELEDVLIRADLGVETSMRIVETVGKGRHDKMISPEEVKSLIAEEVERILVPVAKPLVVDTAHKPFVVLMVGVNGSGKTTTIGKLAAQWRTEGKKVVLAAGDTFRAAAIEQLKVWGTRTGATVIAREQGSDAAGVAHEAIVEARAAGADILMVDTAGRLQNRTELMAELEKVVRVIKKLEPSAPHAVLLVLDATVGQNALSQVEAFTRIAGVTGLVMTKLDGTARGGILVAIAAKHKLPVHLIGVGEAAEDLQPFTARDFARAIAGLN
ncbi:signal recognition particle-docking protein FtsY [Xanthobacter autotrophicus]|uniref:signal recognition particle-docking protein FtsY n=1 Tax=Xanthobacter autotrophicus TaxID=280 RepID=UPI0024A66401|nr:signal recognition particle-docking protein FtsY [Xanthobacter autotrophicus]MDI4655757.1 signal recognition particle-docking protein FtsY [Xanthobacter autotrophicus]